MITKDEPEKADMFLVTPFDLYCPSMKNALENGICETCGSYWPSKAAKDRHKKCHRVIDGTESEDEVEWIEDAANNSIETNAEQRKPIFENIFDLFQGPFTDIDVDKEE